MKVNIEPCAYVFKLHLNNMKPVIYHKLHIFLENAFTRQLILKSKL